VIAARFSRATALAAGSPNALAVDNSAWHPSVFVGFEPDGRVIIMAHRSDMGTGIRTALPMVLADELEADWTKVRIEQAIGDRKYGSQETDGSISIRNFYEGMRQAGATARAMLENAAATQWGVPATECQAKNHQVLHLKSDKKLGFGELVGSAAKQPVPKPADLRLKSPADFRYIGTDFPITDLEDICAGRAMYGIDAKRPDMVYASIERSPVFGGKLKMFDDAETKNVNGVLQTVKIDPFKPPCEYQALGGIAVIANNTWAAMQGRKKLKVEWDDGPNASYDSTAYRKELEETARKAAKSVRSEGNVDAIFNAGGKTLEASYFVPHLAHASMEPPAAVAEFKGGRVSVWAPTQDPQAAQETVAKELGIDPKNVTCYVTLLGGGFGRKAKQDFIAEAAILSKQVGKPVQVTWSREDDIRFDYYHAVSSVYMKAAVDEKGRPTAWLQRSVFPSKSSIFNLDQRYGDNEEMGMGWIDLPYAIPNLRIENGPADPHVRIGWLRSVANIYHAFAIHSFVDELAAAAQRDRVEYVLDLLGAPRTLDLRPANRRTRPDPYVLDTARLRRVVEAVAEKSDWGKKKSGNGHGFGIAVHRSFVSYVATVVEVEIDAKGTLRIPRVDTVVDAGRIVNPDRVKAQFEGAAVFGTSLAMMGEITAANGRIVQSNFNNYPVARIHEAPRNTQVTLLSSEAPPTGVGEPGVPPIAPAICNAIFAATGKRVRELPIKKTKLV